MSGPMNDAVATRLTRRSFVFGASAAAGGLILSSLSASAQGVAARGAGATGSEVTVWVVISPDDQVTIRVARSEFGQGVMTSLPMLVAEELECDWSKVQAEYAPVAEHLARGRAWGNMVTTDSVSVRTSHEYLRRAGAQARTMLLEEAASRWACPVSECSARDSVITHGPTTRRFRFGELAEAASTRPVPSNAPLKRPSEWRLLGKSMSPIGLEAKVTGKPIYAIDVRLPGMLYAAVKGCPALGGKLKGFDAAQVSGMPGVRRVLAVGDDAVAVVADSWWRAKKALDALPILWDETAVEGVTTDGVLKTMREGLDAADSFVGRRSADPDAGLGSAVKTVTAEYHVPYLAHATLEPQTCTAWITADRAEVWAPTQNGEGTMAVVAALLQRPPSQIIIHKCHAGGGFGRRGLSQDWTRQAVQIARAIGLPVKMVWSREQDMTHDYYRPLVAARLVAGLDARGGLVGWKVRLCGASIFALLAPHFMRDGRDMGQMNGFLDRDMSYDAPFEVSCVTRNHGLPVGFWRAVNYSQNCFFREAFIDEMAHAAGTDPVSFRRRLLAKSPRTQRVLDETARRAHWGHAPSGVFQGIAVAEFADAICGQVVELSVASDGAIKIHRVVCVLDAGHIVHPDTVVAQTEGCIIQALGAALTGEITVAQGRVEQTSFVDYPLLRMNETPRIETTILAPVDPDTARWGGVGETGVPPLAPALVNAVYAATGQRIRSLPMKNHKLRPRL